MRRVLLVLACASTLLACGAAPPQKVAGEFMQAYYQADALEDALPLTTGAARAKVAADIRSEHAGRTVPAAPPEVTLLSEQSLSQDVATYVYRVRPRTIAVEGAAEVFHVSVTLRQRDDGWRVSSFSENDAPPV